ncbi:DNA-binding transcriptional regulator, FadR family (plasmid) [Nostoc flagelliforme CCNUN1]|uniref:DNA-binding transcriptional regulator, FadR family n=1 Tax=Nostoc flagelliforme CCNUN1 TaxID=2038116 RepID=A0A2K8T8R7_9NOSO|nr:PriCT-2 domain-containing protein [Nostoc flagelliforme]AUB44097.1 DNA-binding transcriptional regulator, FadR family [Nostoc flagelliforme CCNUN1]
MTNPVVESRRTALSGKKSIYDSAFLPPVIPSNKIKFAFNATGRNKDWDFKKLAANFQDTEGTLADVQHHIKAGHAICAGLLGGKWRSKANVIGSQWLLLDIDNSDVARDEDGKPIKDENGNSIKVYDHQLTIEEALVHPFIKKHCALIYTTASHKPEWHKFRLIFLLPQYVQGADTVEACTRFLMQQLPHDPACKDASRVFYGSTEAEFPLVNPEATLPAEWISEAIALALHEREEYQLRIQEIESRRKQWLSISLTEGWNIDQLIQQALSFIPPRTPGSGNYDECRQVLMALVNHYGATDAEIIAEQWSPSIKGDTWNIHAKIRSFRRGGITLGTLFHIAKQYGFRFPQRQYQEFSPKLRTITREQWLATHGIKREVEDFVKSLTQVADKAHKFIGEVIYQPTPTTPTTPAQTKKLDVDVWFNPEDRTQAYLDAAKSGKKFILDITHAGGGKSHTAGAFTPEQFGVTKLFYISAEHRNPTVATLEAWTDLPVRHNGLVASDTKLTPLGNPHIHWPQFGEEPNIEGTCYRTPLFHALAAKGYQTETNAEASLNPICNACKHRANCAGYDSTGSPLEKIKGATFRRDRRNALSTPRIRANINSLPTPEDITSSGAFVDEVNRQLQPVDFTEVSLSDFDYTMMEVQTKLPQIYNKIQNLILPVRSLLTGEIPPRQETYHGYSDYMVRQFLGEIPDDLPSIINQLETIAPNIEELVQEADSVNLDGVEGDHKSVNRNTLKFIRAHLNKQATSETKRNIDNLPVRWLVPLLEVIGNLKTGALRVKGKKLIIGTNTTRQSDVLKALDFVFLMDATAKRQTVAKQLGVNPEEILVISEVQPDYSNLTIHQIKGFGLLGKDRSEPLKARISALRKELDQRHKGKIGYIDHKSSKSSGDGHWFVDNRGSNAYQELDALCSFGTPYQDIGALQQSYITTTGDRDVSVDSENFQDFVDEQVQAEVIQCAGRLRANRRPESELTYYVVSDKDLSYLLSYYPGCTLTQSLAFDITPLAGTAKQQTRWAILQGFKQLVAAGAQIKQKTIASIAGISQSLVSKTALEFGGWKTLKKILLALYSSLYRSSNIFPDVLSEDERWFIDEYFPLLFDDYPSNPEAVVKEVVKIAIAQGCQSFQRIMNGVRVDIKAWIIDSLISILPPEILELVRREHPLTT